MQLSSHAAGVIEVLASGALIFLVCALAGEAYSCLRGRPDRVVLNLDRGRADRSGRLSERSIDRAA